MFILQQMHGSVGKKIKQYYKDPETDPEFHTWIQLTKLIFCKWGNICFRGDLTSTAALNNP